MSTSFFQSIKHWLGCARGADGEQHRTGNAGSRSPPCCVYKFAHPPQIVAFTWISGMAEGGLISVELRAYRLTHDARYLQSATQGFHVMTQPLAQGGTLDATGNAVWFEEYPQLPATHVLNGHIYALFGLFDYYRVDR